MHLNALSLGAARAGAELPLPRGCLRGSKHKQPICSAGRAGAGHVVRAQLRDEGHPARKVSSSASSSGVAGSSVLSASGVSDVASSSGLAGEMHSTCAELPTGRREANGRAARDAPRASPSRPPLDAAHLHNAVHAIILAGGPSKNPVARHRAVAATPYGANLCLIDVPISSAISSGLAKLYVLTQWSSYSLNSYIAQAYPPVTFGGARDKAFVDVLTCTQTPDNDEWYRGSAEAVARNLDEITEPLRGGDEAEDFLILSGQAVYKMDFERLIATHRATGADITMVTYCVDERSARSMGVVRSDPATGRVLNFCEKPGTEALAQFEGASQCTTPDKPYEASLGIYVFRKEALQALLSPNGPSGDMPVHFGHDVLPVALSNGLHVQSHLHRGFWKDVSRLRDFYDASLALAHPSSPIRMHDVDNTIVRRALSMPPTTLHNSELQNVLVGDGTVLRDSTLSNCVLGSRTFVDSGCNIANTLILGNDIYSNDASRAAQRAAGEPVFGIGRNCTISGAVIDVNGSVGDGCVITNAAGVQEADREADDGFVIADGIVVVMQGKAIKPGTVI